MNCVTRYLEESPLITAALISVTVVGLVLGLVGWIAAAACTSKSQIMNVKWHSWGPLQGCMVEVRGERLPIRNVRVTL